MDLWLDLIIKIKLDERDLAAITCWAIWSDRNNVIHGKPISLPKIKCDWISSYIQNFSHAQVGISWLPKVTRQFLRISQC